MAGKQPLEFLRPLAHLQPVEEKIGDFQPDSEPVSDLLLLLTLLRTDSRIRCQVRRSLFPFQNYRPNQAGSDPVRSSSILPIDRVQLLKRSLRALEVAKLKQALQPAGVGLLHQRIDVAIIEIAGVLNPRSGFAQYVSDVGGRCLPVWAEMPAELSLDSPDLLRPGLFQALCLAIFQDELFFAFGVSHLLSTSS